MERLDLQRAARGEPALSFSLALHVGDVMYGNVGAPDCLDFTVIGLAVSLVARLDGLPKHLNESVLVSEDFARLCSRPMTSLGHHRLRGLSEPVEVFAPRALEPRSA